MRKGKKRDPGNEIGTYLLVHQCLGVFVIINQTCNATKADAKGFQNVSLFTHLNSNHQLAEIGKKISFESELIPDLKLCLAGLEFS